MNTLDQAVQNLDNLTQLLPALERLGTIHANMGIKKEQLTVSIAGSKTDCFCCISLSADKREPRNLPNILLN